ncbi:MAG: hypothetical protein WBK08_09045 [Nitrospira sp.]|nr:MAG: hypothetical protein E8D42_04615 [Nitrospira sp.]
MFDGKATAVLICFVCLCVVSQLLGAPVTLLGLLISDTPVESLSEDFSIPPIIPKPGQPSHSSFSVSFQPAAPLPIVLSAVFHPPQG